jgi:hypothetical protein
MDSIDSQIIMKELMKGAKGPNKTGGEDSENAISDDQETQNFQSSRAPG